MTTPRWIVAHARPGWGYVRRNIKGVLTYTSKPEFARRYAKSTALRIAAKIDGQVKMVVQP